MNCGRDGHKKAGKNLACEGAGLRPGVCNCATFPAAATHEAHRLSPVFLHPLRGVPFSVLLSPSHSIRLILRSRQTGFGHAFKQMYEFFRIPQSAWVSAKAWAKSSAIHFSAASTGPLSPIPLLRSWCRDPIRRDGRRRWRRHLPEPDWTSWRSGPGMYVWKVSHWVLRDMMVSMSRSEGGASCYPNVG